MLPLSQSTEQMPVKINIHTTFWSENDKQTIELTTFGKYYKKSNASFLQYEEEYEEGKMNTIVKWTEQEAFFMRSGKLKMRLRFRENEQLKGRYDTPYGNFAISTNTKQLKYAFDQQQCIGNAEILYDLMMEGSRTGTYHMELTFREDQ